MYTNSKSKQERAEKGYSSADLNGSFFHYMEEVTSLAMEEKLETLYDYPHFLKSFPYSEFTDEERFSIWANILNDIQYGLSPETWHESKKEWARYLCRSFLKYM